MNLLARQLAAGHEVTLLGNPGHWFVVVAVDGDLLRLARRAGSVHPSFSIGIQAVQASRGPAARGPEGLDRPI